MFLNIAAYKFIKLPPPELSALQDTLKSYALDNHLRGTILLSTEGINLMLTGLPEAIENFKRHIQENNFFKDLSYKESYADTQTFDRLLVKIKKEIIAFGIENIDPACKSAAYVTPIELKKWLDEEQEIVFLDARNDYEIATGTFKKAIHLNIQHFRDFPEAAKKLDPALKEKTVVTFCTGGIRCEKAALLLNQYGFKNVYQLAGGILEYFKNCGNVHYQGECFVFDKRGSLTAENIN